MRKVVQARVRGGGSIFANFKYRWWELTLDCGHMVERRIRWKPIENAPRGFAALHNPPTTDRLPAAPKRARCEECE